MGATFMQRQLSERSSFNEFDVYLEANVITSASTNLAPPTSFQSDRPVRFPHVRNDDLLSTLDALLYFVQRYVGPALRDLSWASLPVDHGHT